MREYNRIDIAKQILVRKEEDIPGNFTSVMGEYAIEGKEKTGFYKPNGCMLIARDDADAREALAADILDIVGFPHAEIDLTYDSRTGKAGCVSYSILKENEQFISTDLNITRTSSKYPVNEYIEKSVELFSRNPGVTKEMEEARRGYLAQAIYINCIIDNRDVKEDNMEAIRNTKTGKYRNAECYDFGLSFFPKESLLGREDKYEVMKELVSEYYPYVKKVMDMVNTNLTPEKIDETLNQKVYQEAFREKIEEIRQGIYTRANQSKELEKQKKLGKLNGQEILSINQISQKTQRTKPSLKAYMRNLLGHLKKTKEERTEE